MEALLTFFESFSAQVTGLLTGLLAGFFLLECLFGYKLMRLWISLIGFLIGFTLGAVVSGLLIPAGDYALLLMVAIGLVVGIIAALIANKLYRAGVFIMVFWPVFLAVSGLFDGGEKWLGWVGILLGIGIGILAGLLSLRFMRVWVILSTALAGGLCAAQLFLELFKVDAVPPSLGLGLLFALIGLVVQFKTTSLKKTESQK